jgi:hypothetical protein
LKLNNLNRIIAEVSTQFDIPRERVEQVTVSYFQYLTKNVSLESLNEQVNPEITVPYLGTFCVNKRKFFSQLLKLFIILRKLQVKKTTLTPGSIAYEKCVSRYKSTADAFRFLWKHKQTKPDWKFRRNVKYMNLRTDNYFKIDKTLKR